MKVEVLPVLYWFLASGSVDVGFAGTPSPSIALQHIGYDGSWERFCDRNEIKKDFPRLYKYHEMRRLRLMICILKIQNNITRDSLTPFVGYKYCVLKKEHAEDFMEKFIDRFSLGDEKNKAQLLAPGPIVDQTACFKEVAPAFEKWCVAEMNPFFKMFHEILARACIVEWLTTETILSHLQEVCAGRRLTSDIDWKTIIDSIYVQEK